jgi:hypothetical protein
VSTDPEQGGSWPATENTPFRGARYGGPGRTPPRWSAQCPTLLPVRDAVPVLLLDGATPGPEGIGLASRRRAQHDEHRGS